jgi:hypothetical protein
MSMHSYCGEMYKPFEKWIFQGLVASSCVLLTCTFSSPDRAASTFLLKSFTPPAPNLVAHEIPDVSQETDLTATHL